MEAQLMILLRRPSLALSSIAIGSVFSVVFLYFDDFFFVSPYFVLYVDPGRLPILLLDIAVSILSGLVLTISVYEIQTFPRRKGPLKGIGFLGIIAAFVAGACPCFYLVPLLAVAGGFGGALGALGILVNDYQIPIKFSSIALLSFALFATERTLRAACSIQPGQIP